MALFRSIISSKCSIPSVSNTFRRIQTKTTRETVQKWREDRGLDKNPNAHGPLTDLPDYTFMDGNRLTPLGSHQKQRIIKQRELAAKMIRLIREIDDGKLMHKRLQEESQRNREDIISNKFKPKGVLLIKKK
ncbi:39S ribosomal protein L52, mitochondrial [Pseudolycoriella hygida]|uniref:Large ribosomal subunit protein mL52 n=1 Tax=Pseudolycoriella hygida TaxID=35572 RepID=A0A9Q0S349_9DIPT|nr:39S ribosomal protein L52, mitochondrial [Pseudolycoriella hygida]